MCIIRRNVTVLTFDITVILKKRKVQKKYIYIYVYLCDCTVCFFFNVLMSIRFYKGAKKKTPKSPPPPTTTLQGVIFLLPL